MENGDFTILNLELNDSESNFNELKTRYENLNLTIYSNFSLYNSIIDNLTSAKANLESLKNTNVTNETAIEIDKIIKPFEEMVGKLLGYGNMKSKWEFQNASAGLSNTSD